MTDRRPASPMSGRRTAIVGGIMVAAGPFSITLYAPALPTIVTELGTTAAMGTWSLSAYFAAFAFTQLLCGPLSDSFGRRRITIVFMAIFSLGSLVAAFAPSIEWLLAGRALQGVGVSVGAALSRAMVRDQFTGSEAIGILTLINLILTVAPAIAPTLGSVLLLAGDWHLIFYVMAIYGAMVVVLTVCVTRETHPTSRRVRFSVPTVLGHYRALLGSPAFLVPAALLSLSFGGFYTFAALLPFVLIEEIGLTTFQFALVMLIQTGAFITGNLIAGVLSRRLSGRGMVRLGLMMVGLAALGFTIGLRLWPGEVVSVMVPVGFWMLALAFIGPSATAAAMAEFGGIAGAAGALTGFFQIGGGFVGSLLAGLMFPTAIGALSTLVPVMAVLTIAIALAGRIAARPNEPVAPQT